jgi:hypothetical protein
VVVDAMAGVGALSLRLLLQQRRGGGGGGGLRVLANDPTAAALALLRHTQPRAALSF